MRYLVLTLAVLAAPVPEPKVGSVPLPDGVADAAGKLGFVAGSEGSIDALDLATGKVRWSNKLAQKPVALEGGRVLCLATKGNKLEVVAFDAADGKKVFTSEALAFPEWVGIRLGPVSSDAGRSFQSVVKVANGELYLRWRAAAWYWGGARPSPEIEAAARKNAEGVFQVNLTTGKVATVPVDRWPGDVKVSAEIAKVATRPVGDLFAEKRVRVVGEQAVAVELEQNKVVLRRWNLADAKPLDPVTLAEGEAFRIDFAQEAGKVLVHQTAPEGKEWTVFDLTTGKQVAKLPFTPTTREATVIGARAFFVVNPPSKGPRPGPFSFATLRALQAVDLATGKTLWEHALEAERHSPPPP